MTDSGEEHGPNELVESASAAGGAIVGVAASLAAGPFAGSAVGALAARAFRSVGHEIERRLIAPRQARRIAQAARAAEAEIGVRVDAGEEPRADGFFVEDGTDSAATELLEGTMLAAADAWESRKVPYLGRLFASVAFDPTVTVADANYLLRLAQRLTYRQLVLVSFWKAAQDGGRYESAIVELGVDQDVHGGRMQPALSAEMDDLMRADMLGAARDDGTVGLPEPTIEGIATVGTLKGTELTRIRLTPLGDTLNRLMGLDQVPRQDLDAVLAAVRGET